MRLNTSSWLRQKLLYILKILDELPLPFLQFPDDCSQLLLGQFHLVHISTVGLFLSVFQLTLQFIDFFLYIVILFSKMDVIRLNLDKSVVLGTEQLDQCLKLVHQVGDCLLQSDIVLLPLSRYVTIQGRWLFSWSLLIAVQDCSSR